MTSTGRKIKINLKAVSFLFLFFQESPHTTLNLNALHSKLFVDSYSSLAVTFLVQLEIVFLPIASSPSQTPISWYVPLICLFQNNHSNLIPGLELPPMLVHKYVD